MKHQPSLILLNLILGLTPCTARTYYVSPTGSNQNTGTLHAPFASLTQVQKLVAPGDTVYIRGGEYKVTTDQIMGTGLQEDNKANAKQYIQVFLLNKSGKEGLPICYFGYPGERPVFDFSNIISSENRISAFWVSGSWLHLKNFEITGVQVHVKGHTQSECISARGGSNCIFENLSMHDGMAIGYYQTAGSNNLVLNCDAYDNYDDYSEGPYGGNVDGFGGHVKSMNDTGNVFRGCRAWNNSDDGFDLINCWAAFTFDHCWSFRNGYKPRSMEHAGDGTGFKSGGFGMRPGVRFPRHIPSHTIKNCIAAQNYARGFYANHHLAGNLWLNNSAFDNASNYCMRNRVSIEKIEDRGGYEHTLRNNLSLQINPKRQHISDCDSNQCTIENNSFLAPTPAIPSAAEFLSIDVEELKRPRKADGSLPDIDFLKAIDGSLWSINKQGYTL